VTADATVLLIGVGATGEQLAAQLAARGTVGRIVLASRSPKDDAALAIRLTTGSRVDAVRLDATRLDDVAELLGRLRPELVVQAASLRSPSALRGRTDPVAVALTKAGFAIRLPHQVPVALTVMQAARAAGYDGPVANLSFPDVVGPILATQGLAPTVGLGNAAMILLRVRETLRESPRLPLVRVLAHHTLLQGSMQALPPEDDAPRARVYLGEEGERADELAYAGPGLPPGPRHGAVTAASSLPVLEALLPGAAPLRWSTPAPHGLPGGYPVVVSREAVELDLPPGLDREGAVRFNEQTARGDGVDRIDADGTVHFTEACREAVAAVAPDLAEPLQIAALEERAARLDEVLDDRR
jgi:hypothetical protein